MTNFQADAPTRRRLITPERALFALPILVGVALAGLLLAAGLSPLLVELQQRRTLVAEMEGKQADLPLLKRRLDLMLEDQTRSLGQQERLFQLVAGSDALTTWLFQVNRLARQQGVSILSAEPQPVERLPTTTTPPPGAVTPAPAAAPVPGQPPPVSDPLVNANIEKHSNLFVVQGSFPQLLGFLRQLELLQVMVLASDLELETVATTASPGAASQGPAVPQTKLKMRLSAYGRVAPTPARLR